MAKRNPAKALKLFDLEHNGVKEIVNTRLGKRGEIIVITNGNNHTIPKQYHGVPISVSKTRHAS
jgi:hypothetical protein